MHLLIADRFDRQQVPRFEGILEFESAKVNRGMLIVFTFSK